MNCLFIKDQHCDIEHRTVTKVMKYLIIIKLKNVKIIIHFLVKKLHFWK